MRTFIFLFSTTIFAFISGNSFSQNAKIVIESNKTVSVDEVFDIIKHQTDYTFIYQENLFKDLPKVHLKKGTMSANDLLKASLSNKKFNFNFTNDNTIVIKEAAVSPESKKPLPIEVKGVVVDELGKRITGVNVKIKGTNKTVNTDEDGRYAISVPEDGILIFSFVGYVTHAVVVNGKNVINVTLKLDLNELEVVTVRTGITERKKENFTGAISSFSGKELRMVGNQNVIQSLKTLDPSFIVLDNELSGSNPNRLPVIEVRGKTSISQSSLKNQFGGDPNQPLFVLDGFETTLETIVDLDMNRVASVTLLKDASSTALYGARAANGVVVVETIKPVAGKLQVRYNFDARYEVADLSVYNLMNAEEKLEFERLSGGYTYSLSQDAAKQAIYDQVYNDRLADVRRGVNTYWLKVPVQTGITRGHTLNFSGGSDDFRYMVGLNYKTLDGVMNGSGRDTWGYNIDLTYRKNKWNVTNKLFVNGYDSQESPYGSFSTWANTNPYYKKYNDDGSIPKYLGGYATITENPVSNKINPLYNANLNSFDKTKNFTFQNNLQVIYDINSYLKAQAGLQVVKTIKTTDKFVSPDHTDFDGVIFDEKGSLSNSNRKDFSWQGNMMLTYGRTFNDKHLINGTVRTEAESTTNELITYDLVGFPTGAEGNPSLAYMYKPDDLPETEFREYRRNSFLTTLNYAYDRRFLLDLTYRIDGSTAFGTNNKFSPFWGGGVGWNLNNEFKMNQDIVNILKLRASLGITGNQSFGTFASSDVYVYNSSFNNFGQGSELVQMANADLEWQKTKILSLGIDVAMYKNRFTATLNAYNKITNPLIAEVLLPSSTGLNSYPLNFGELNVKGVEGNLAFCPIYKLENNLVWRIGMTASAIESKYAGLNNKLESLDVAELNSGSLYRFRDGYSPDDIWAVPSLGIDPATGKEVFLKADGQSSFYYDSKDIKRLGSSRPKVEGIFSNNFSYKNFNLGISIRYRYGGDLFNKALYNKVENISKNNVFNNQDVRALYDRWQNPGDIAQFKGISLTAFTPISSRFIQRENTISGESINFGYQVTDKKWLKDARLSALRASAYMNDIFRKSTVLAERGTEYPFSRTISFSINASF